VGAVRDGRGISAPRGLVVPRLHESLCSGRLLYYISLRGCPHLGAPPTYVMTEAFVSVSALRVFRGTSAKVTVEVCFTDPSFDRYCGEDGALPSLMQGLCSGFFEMSRRPNARSTCIVKFGRPV